MNQKSNTTGISGHKSDSFFSVVIPTYNRAHILPETIKSVLDQTYQKYEIIVVDNGSTDNTSDVVKSFDDFRIRYFYQLGSGSPASPRNKGIVESLGDWIAFLDSDDYWYPEKLAQVADAVTEQSCELVSHYQQVQNSKGVNISLLGFQNSNEISYRSLLLTENSFATSSVAINRKFANKHSLLFNEAENYFAVEDYDLWLRILASGGRASVIPVVLGINQESEGHLGTLDLFFCNLAHLHNDHVWKIQQFTASKKALEKRLLAALMLRRAMTEIRSNNYRQMLSELFQAVMKSPLEPIRYMFYRISQRWNHIYAEHPE
jgi:glycosyltransferase involved in cell wall biosynthesis